jgi:hypothetical protein
MVTDILRSHMLGWTQILRDSAEKTWIRVYPSAPGAKAYPGWHAFGSPVWESDFPVPDGIGVYPHPFPWRGKRYPAPPGQHFRGLPEWYQFGLPSADLSVPPITDTCTAPAISPIGGVLIGGASWPATPVPSPVALLGGIPTTTVRLPDYFPATVYACSTPSTPLTIRDYRTSCACVCGSPSTEVVIMIQSCIPYTLLSSSLDDLALPPTNTPITKYDLTPPSGGSTITGIVPRSLVTGPQWIELVNVSPNPITIISSSPSSGSANRVQLPPTYGSQVTLAQWDTITLSYDPCGPSAQWVVQACTVDTDASLAEILAYVESHLTVTLSTVTGQLLQTSQLLGGTWTNISCSVDLAPGIWVITGDLLVAAGLDPMHPGELNVESRLFDSTSGAAVANSAGTNLFQTLLLGGVSIDGQTSVCVRYQNTDSVPHTIRWQAQQVSSTPSATASAIGDSTGNNAPTNMVAVKVG